MHVSKLRGSSHAMHFLLIIAIVLCDPVLGVESQKLNNSLSNDQATPDALSSIMQSWFEKIEKRIDEKAEFLLQQVKTYYNKIAKIEGVCESTSDVCDCSDIKSMGFNTSGVYRLFVVVEQNRYYADAYCDMSTTSGDWTVFQRRKGGCEDFYRRWCEYANGFGDPNEEFWLGNEFVYLLTSKRSYRLRVDLEDWEGHRRYAEYSFFRLTSSEDKYRLVIGDYSGIAGDSLSYHKDQQFTTQDSENDQSAINCAVDRHGAWWYNDCTASNLNGIYYYGGNYSNIYNNGITWYEWLGPQYSYKTTEMKFSRGA